MAARPSFAARLLAWYDRHRRDLPWRRTRDPWAIWVSEVMLQQTRVETVREAFTAFLRRFPTPAAFAAADDDALLQAWRGLGYYRRARLLRDGARQVCEQHGGEVPADPDRLAELPGIGPYTRGAVASIAFDRPELAIDGNVERVVARHRALRENVKLPATLAMVRATVAGWLDRVRPGDFNQALMDLGATVCVPNGAPLCERCPVAADCRGRELGLAAGLPVRSPAKAFTAVRARVAWIPRGDLVLACRLPAGAVNAGQLELPGPGLLTDLPGPAGLAAALRARFGLLARVGAALATARHSITSHRIEVTLHGATAGDDGPLLRASPADPTAPWTTASRKLFRALGRARPTEA